MARINGRIFAVFCAALAAAGALCPSAAITRWSTLQMLPSADMYPAGRIIADADLAWEMKTDFTIHQPVSVQQLHIGFSEWVGMDVGYAGGFTMGLKACVLKEDAERWYVPTLSFGLQNVYMNREALYFHGDVKEKHERNRLFDSYPRNEFYAVAAKSSEWAKLRGHVGIMSAATYSDRADLINPFVGFETYFGQGLYITVEGQRRSGDLLLSVFAVYRPFPDRFEVSVGFIDAPGLAGRDESTRMRPELRVGIRANLGGGYNSLDGLGGVEDRIDRYKEQVASFNARMDSLERDTRWNSDRIAELSALPEERGEDRARVVDELVKIRNMYDQEPFDPELVRNMIDQFRDRYPEFAPHMRVIITDHDADHRVRRLAVSLIGEMGDYAAANILISILERFEEPALKIETIITLGKLKVTEARCRAILAKLRGDPDAGVAFTANEVYNALFINESLGSGKTTMPIVDEEHIGDAVPERRLGR